MTKFWVDEAGKVLRATDDSYENFLGAKEAVTTPPESGKQVWNFKTQKWSKAPVNPQPQTVDELRAELVASGFKFT